MNKEELITKIAEEVQITKKQAKIAAGSFLEGITEALSKDQKVSLVGFGTFSVSQRKERKGVNPQTREPLTIPATKVPSFKAGKKLKEAVK